MIVGRLGPFSWTALCASRRPSRRSAIASLPDGVFPTRIPREICAFELTISEIGRLSLAFLRSPLLKSDPSKRGFHEVRFHHGRSLKVALREIALGQIGSVKDGAAGSSSQRVGLYEDRFRVVLKRIIDHNGLFSRCFVSVGRLVHPT